MMIQEPHNMSDELWLLLILNVDSNHSERQHLRRLSLGVPFLQVAEVLDNSRARGIQKLPCFLIPNLTGRKDW